jgi:hypothetical protein
VPLSASERRGTTSPGGSCDAPLGVPPDPTVRGTDTPDDGAGVGPGDRDPDTTNEFERDPNDHVDDPGGAGAIGTAQEIADSDTIDGSIRGAARVPAVTSRPE